MFQAFGTFLAVIAILLIILLVLSSCRSELLCSLYRGKKKSAMTLVKNKTAD